MDGTQGPRHNRIPGVWKWLKGEFVAAGPVSRIRRVTLQPRKLLNRNVIDLSMTATLSVVAGFASHRRHMLRLIKFRHDLVNK
jgi:hypothetical protein